MYHPEGTPWKGYLNLLWLVMKKRQLILVIIVVKGLTLKSKSFSVPTWFATASRLLLNFREKKEMHFVYMIILAKYIT